MEQKKYEEEFIERVVRPILNGEATISKMAKEFKVSHSTVSGWVKRKRREEENAKSKTDESNELHKLREEVSDLKEKIALLTEENQSLKEEKDIMRKAASIFAQNQK